MVCNDVCMADGCYIVTWEIGLSRWAAGCLRVFNIIKYYVHVVECFSMNDAVFERDTMLCIAVGERGGGGAVRAILLGAAPSKIRLCKVDILLIRNRFKVLKFWWTFLSGRCKEEGQASCSAKWIWFLTLVVFVHMFIEKLVLQWDLGGR